MQNRTNIFFIAGILIVTVGVVIGAVVWLGGRQGPQTVAATVVPAIGAADHARAASSSPVSVVEYGDFECPACGAYEPVMQQLEKDYAGKVEFVFRNFPLTQIHPNAMGGAEAAEAAGIQGKYWEMHDLLFAKQTEWSTGTPAAALTYFDKYATSLGLDKAKFDADMSSSAVAAKIQADIQSGNDATIDHTPTFFVNLKQIQNPAGYADFKSVIDAALAAS